METVSRKVVQAVVAEDRDAVLVDALPEESYREEHLPGAVHLPPEAVRARARRVLSDRDRTVIVYSGGSTCDISTRTAKLLERLDYRDVREYPGGKSDWRAAGYWFESDTASVSAGETGRRVPI